VCNICEPALSRASLNLTAIAIAIPASAPCSCLLFLLPSLCLTPNHSQLSLVCLLDRRFLCLFRLSQVTYFLPYLSLFFFFAPSSCLYNSFTFTSPLPSFPSPIGPSSPPSCSKPSRSSFSISIASSCSTSSHGAASFPPSASNSSARPMLALLGLPPTWWLRCFNCPEVGSCLV